ncbi:glycogen-binding domain-containing protein [Desulfogranum japonicum]|uniref:glycogen-binding domain-containing protein n=1 Tax=Desulfogranum japonicum TaxID=231447 RepID=UPI0005597C73|nr:glycogen-binding domain-containing protein [Desulfogranum japonicum]
MEDYLISQFIDDELNLDEKITFVDKVHDSHQFACETKSFLEQEKLLHGAPEKWMPGPIPSQAVQFSLQKALSSWWQPIASFAVAMVIVFFIFTGTEKGPHEEMAGVNVTPIQNKAVNYRFVLYQEAVKVEIIGSFTNWKKVALLPTGIGNYWEITLPVVHGEHKYSFVVDGKMLLPDPTVAAREPDDFGTINSVIKVET